MLTRLGNTTGRNWSMLFPADGDVGDGVGLLLAALVIHRAIDGGAEPQVSLDGECWILAGVAISVLLAGLLVWQLSQGQRPDDLLTAFPIVLLLILPAPSGANSTYQQPQQSSIRHPAFSTVVPLAFVVLVILISPFHGGIQWGPRFLLPIIPPLTVVLIDRLAGLWGPLINRSARVGLAAALIALLAAGSYSTWLGVKFMQDSQTSSEFMSEVIRQSPETSRRDGCLVPAANGAVYVWRKNLADGRRREEDVSTAATLAQTDRRAGLCIHSALTWTHIDPQASMGPRIAPVEGSEKVYVNAPTQYVEISRYQLLK